MGVKNVVLMQLVAGEYCSFDTLLQLTNLAGGIVDVEVSVHVSSRSGH
jgi:hypothetical protein